MGSFTYPAPFPTSDADVQQIHQALQNTSVLARRLRTLVDCKFISDAILTQRFNAAGGGLFYETGEPIFAGEDARIIAAGAEYPLLALGNGKVAAAKTEKWGIGTRIMDEKIAQSGMPHVQKGLTKLSNQVVKTVDALSMAVLNSAITTTQTASAKFKDASAEQIFNDVMTAFASMTDLDEGFAPDTVVVETSAWVAAMGKFVAAGYLPRESTSENPALTGKFPEIAGVKWLPSPRAYAGTALIVDSTQIGGMADQNLYSPEYVSASAAANVQVSTQRIPGVDGYELHARRVTVPVVTEPLAGIKIEGVS